MNRQVALLAPAKVNLFLRVLAREASGFHQIETLFCALELADELDVEAGGDASLALDVLSPPEAPGPPPDLGPVTANLAWRAAEAFFRAAGMPPRARIRLTKRIPAGAGLGGGSSDAAAVLRALNAAHDDPLPEARLLQLAGGLGSDVPFFLAGSGLALAWGRGTRLQPLPTLPSRPVLLALPDLAVSTPDAYARLAAHRGDGYVAPPALLPEFRGWDAVAASAHNDFEDVVCAAQPRLRRLLAALADTAPRLARMSGTGSAFFAVYDDVGAAERARDALAAGFADVRWVLTRTAEGGAAPA